MENFDAVCHARTMFYPGDAYPFLEAELSIPEKLTGLARKCRKAVADHNARAAMTVGRRRNRPWRLARCRILIKREKS
jgi:hypothetical protein